MLFTAQKEFTAEGRRLMRGDTIELSPSLRTQQLIDLRYLLPADPDVAALASDSIITHTLKKKKKD